MEVQDEVVEVVEVKKKKKLIMNVVQRIITVSNLSLAKAHSNVDSNEIGKLLDVIDFNDEERAEFKIKIDRDSGLVKFDETKASENSEIEISKHIADSLFHKFMHTIHSFDAYVVLVKLAEYVWMTPEEKDLEEVEFDKLADIKSADNFILSVLEVNQHNNWSVWAEDNNITIEDLKHLAIYMNQVTFSDEEVENHKITIEAMPEGGEKLVTNLAKDEDFVLRNRKVSHKSKEAVKKLFLKIGLVRTDYKIAQKLKLV